MNADRDPGNQRPREGPQSAGGFVDAQSAAGITAPTTSPTGLASTPVVSRDLLFGRLALHTGFIDEEVLDKALAQQQTNPSRSLAEILLDNGSISEKERQAIELLCETHSARHGDDPQQSLASLTLAPTVSYPQPPGSATVTYSQKSTDGKHPVGTFGDYQLLREIARGGMEVVYKARQTKLNRVVALKMIRSGELADAEQVRRFYAEAEAAAKLDHPHIVPVYEVGQANGQHFFSMAFVAGKSLNDSVKSGGPLPPQQAARLMRTVAEAVQFAHDKGIVHRDIKPQNILLDEKDQPRVTDFGLAKYVEAPSELTATGQIMGTPSYMPPEQAKGEIQEIGPMSDVYSLGATLYFLLTGRPPFQTASTAETIRQVIEAEPVATRRLNPAVPRDLETICLNCLRKEQAKRYATAADLAATEPPEKDAAKPDESGKPAPPQEETKPKTSPEPPKNFYYTFIVFPAGDYEIGSVNDAPERFKDEGRHPVKLTRSFALLDREITLEELIAFKPGYTGFMQQFDAKPADAGFGADWYDAVGFCRWLGQQSGLSEGDQSYADPEALDKAQYPREPNPEANWAPRNWPLELGRRGFRLPTESEWEVASRSGARTTFGFGSEVSLLGRFGWFTENSDKHVHPPRKLRPSIRGLFDMDGNLFEWPHDWFENYGVEAIIDPLGAKEGPFRVVRGGCWGNVGRCDHSSTSTQIRRL